MSRDSQVRAMRRRTNTRSTGGATRRDGQVAVVRNSEVQTTIHSSTTLSAIV